MMAYMDFCYSGANIYLGEESPFRVFFNLWDSANPHLESYKAVMKQEILILLLLLATIAILFLFFFKEKRYERY